MLRTYELGADVVCLDTETDRLRITNPVGARILNLHHSGCDLETIARKIASIYAVPFERAFADAGALLESVREDQEFQFQPVEDYRPLTDYTPTRELAPVAQAQFYLPHFCLSVRSESRTVLDRLKQFFTFPDNLATARHEYVLDVYQEHDTWPIVFRGVTVETGLTEKDTAIKVMREINGIASRHYPWTAIFHAAAVARGRSGILIPAIGGSGKTTLSAYLVSKGYQLLNDDVVPLLESGDRLMPVPVPLSIKRGSWALLAPGFPQLSAAVEYGGKTLAIKYLVPDASQVATDPVNCSIILLPAYSADCHEAILEPVSAAEVIRDVIEGGCIMDRPLQPEKVGALVTLLGRTPCYRLEFNDLESAYQAIERILTTLVPD